MDDAFPLKWIRTAASRYWGEGLIERSDFVSTQKSNFRGRKSEREKS